MLTKNTIITFLKDHLGSKPAILGLSGGIDSAVVAYLLVEAIGAEHVHTLIMPSATTSDEDIKHAEQVAKHLGTHNVVMQIQPLLDQYKTVSLDFENPIAWANLQSRIRMTLLFGKANALGGLVVGTGNKSELMTGYFTKYGDGGVDLLPIGGLYKTQVWELARELQVFPEIIEKAPTAGLQPGQTDEQDLGMTYLELDRILQAIEQRQPISQFPAEQVKRVQQRMMLAQHKLQLPPVPLQPTGIKPGVTGTNPWVYPSGLGTSTV